MPVFAIDSGIPAAFLLAISTHAMRHEGHRGRLAAVHCDDRRGRLVVTDNKSSPKLLIRSDE
jgi:hypothetical protein